MPVWSHTKSTLNEMSKKIVLSKSIKKFAKDVEGEIRNGIIRTNTIDTGDLLRSIDSFQVGNFVSFTMLDYGKFTDEGTKYIQPPRKFFNGVIEDMVDEFEDYIEDELFLEITKKLTQR